MAQLASGCSSTHLQIVHTFYLGRVMAKPTHFMHFITNSMQENVSTFIIVVRYRQKFPSLGSRFGITSGAIVLTFVHWGMKWLYTVNAALYMKKNGTMLKLAMKKCHNDNG